MRSPQSRLAVRDIVRASAREGAAMDEPKMRGPATASLLFLASAVLSPNALSAQTIRRHLVFVGALFLATASLVLAQTATGVIRGTVQDSTGAVVVAVQVPL